MKTSESLAVGIPTYNQAAFIGLTIESLLRQTCPPAEIVVSDHQSTDDTAKVVQRFGSMVRYVQPPVGTSYGGQWNFTLSQLKSTWITLLSSDDIAYPNYVATLLRGAKRSARAVLVRGAWNEIDAKGTVLRDQHLLSVKTISHPRRNLFEQRYGPKASFAAFAVRRDAWERAGGVPEGIRSLNDWAFYVRLSPFGDFVYEHEVIAGYRVGHDGDKFEKVRRRLMMFLHDERSMFDEIFPEAAGRLKMRNTRWIAAASRHNFLRYLSDLSEQRERFVREDWMNICEALDSWAASIGEQDRMRRFRDGEVFPAPFRLGDRVKAKIRPAYARLRQ